MYKFFSCFCFVARRLLKKLLKVPISNRRKPKNFIFLQSPTGESYFKTFFNDCRPTMGQKENQSSNCRAEIREKFSFCPIAERKSEKNSSFYLFSSG